ncbi:MAG: oligosaccharide flippase family protein, partial [Candidatus Hydrogenedentes bacterium]|nr:oligosaccharide flippase family protein [Candidatus Hydrogenedentota bacterium]
MADEVSPQQTSGWAKAFGGVFVARIAASAAVLATVLLLGRLLGPARYADLVILLSIMKVASELVGPAMDTTLVRFVAKQSDARPEDSIPYYRAILSAKLALVAVLLLGGVALAAPLQRLLLEPGHETAVSTHAIWIAFAGAAVTVLWGYSQAVYQAQQRFAAYAGFELLNAVSRLVIVGVVLFFAWHGLTTILLAYVLAAVLSTIVAWVCLPSAIFSENTGPSPVWKDMLHFAKWVLAACCFTSLFQRADVFLLAAFHEPKAAIGAYGAAIQLTLLGDLAIGTLFSVLLPKASGLRSGEDARHFLRSFARPMGLAAAAALPIILLSAPIVRVSFGPDYAQTATLFAILLIGTLFAMGSAPAGAALYGLGHSRAIAFLELAKVLATLLLGLFVVPRYGAWGMAWVIAAVKGGVG